MKIVQNSQNRFDVSGIHDPGKNKKKGIAGYKCKAWGWILEKIFHKAVCIKSGKGTVYLNRNSLSAWMKRVQPHSNFSRKELSSSKLVERAIRKLIPSKQKPQQQLEIVPEQVSQSLAIQTFANDALLKQKEQEEFQRQTTQSLIIFCPKVPDAQEKSEKSISQIVPYLFLGRARDAVGTFDLVIWATDLKIFDPASIKYKSIRPSPHLSGDERDALAWLRENDQIHFQNVLMLIEAARARKENVLICDQEGNFESAFFAAAYLMKKFEVSAERAINFLKARRIDVSLDIHSFQDFLTKEFKKDFPLDPAEFVPFRNNKLIGEIQDRSKTNV